MLRILWLVLFLNSGYVFSAIGDSASIDPNISIEHYGIYQSLGQTELSFSAESTAGYHIVIDTKLLEKTTIIPMQPDIVFGFNYAIDDITVDSEWVPVEFEIKHPLIKNYLGQPTTGFKAESTAHKKSDGRFRNGVYYVLRKGRDMVPGEWQLTVRYKNKVVVSHDFVVKDITE